MKSTFPTASSSNLISLLFSTWRNQRSASDQCTLHSYLEVKVLLLSYFRFLFSLRTCPFNYLPSLVITFREPQKEACCRPFPARFLCRHGVNYGVCYTPSRLVPSPGCDASPRTPNSTLPTSSEKVERKGGGYGWCPASIQTPASATSRNSSINPVTHHDSRIASIPSS